MTQPRRSLVISLCLSDHKSYTQNSRWSYELQDVFLKNEQTS